MHVLVTGAGSGIGRATAHEFARRGHTVFAGARRDLDQAPGLHPVRLDVTDARSIATAHKLIEEHTAGAGVDILVNNAGLALPGPIEELSGDDWARQFDTNVFGLVAVTRAVLPAMRARGSGRIVNISSMLGRVTFPGMGAYSATKYAVESISDALRLELIPFGVDVIVVQPGFVNTALMRTEEPPSPGSPYAGLIARGHAYRTREMGKALAPQRVAVAIADAALARRPRCRVVVPASARPVMIMLNGLPARLADRLKRKVMGVS